MRAICLTLPTNRPCAATIAALAEEAAYAADHFDVEVHLLVLDSCDEPTYAEHAAVLRQLTPRPDIVVHHLDEARQRDFLQRVIERSGAAKPDLLLDLMLPTDVSYGACTNRAFLIASALGCTSVHRRDSDSSYQRLDGEPVYPIHHELLSLGKRAVDALPDVTRTRLDPADVYKPVAMVGASFVGELSVDIGEIRELDPEIYYEVVGLWAEAGTPAEERRELVDDSFVGAGTDPFTHDESTLGTPDIWRVDMCNIGLDHQVYERVPLPPATSTIGSDYFLLHLVRDATLPGVVHNRHIVNYYTPSAGRAPASPPTSCGSPSSSCRCSTSTPSTPRWSRPAERCSTNSTTYASTRSPGSPGAAWARTAPRTSAGSTSWTAVTANWAADTPSSPTTSPPCVSGCSTRPRPTWRTSPCS
ncbi:hypothetical protein DWB77_02653 [Streptomyces hundungensis]|uniref:Uncharacterized protein n=1 Tax=Streptomyces hundungensis TaxID=1077946 RepID=A0A387HIH6_9ACTN|nr:hypothetical protein DWB77_02653 [Streptomyces hundungensis]